MENQTNSAQRSRIPLWMAFMPLFAVIGAIILISAYVLAFGSTPSAEQEQWGQFGDFVGGVLNPLLAFFSIVLLLTTVRLQLDELQLTREEMRRSSKALEEQSQAFARQNFESFLFNSIRRLQDFIESLWQSNLRGREVVLHAAEQLKTHYQNLSAHMDTQRAAVQGFEGIYPAYPFLAPYFRMLYHLFKLIDEEPSLCQQDRERYSSLVRAQLDSSELRLLFYNGTVGDGAQGMMLYVVKYGLLKHVKPGDLLNEEHRAMFYEPAAFQDAATRAALMTSRT